MLRPSELQVEVALTAFTVGYRPGNLIADQLLPVVPVSQEIGRYFVFDKEAAFEAPPTLRADGTRPNTSDIKAKSVPFELHEYALDTPITDRQERAADGVLRLRQNKVRSAQDKIMVDYERRVANLIRSTCPGEDVAGGAKWSNAANAGIEAMLDDAKDYVRAATGGLEPNVIVIPRPATRHVKRNEAIRDMIKYTDGSLLVNGELPPVIQGLRVLIPGAMVNVGTTATNVRDVWGNDVIVAHVAGLAELDNPSLGYTLRQGDFTTYTWRDDPITTNYYRPTVMQAEVLTLPEAAYVFRDVI